MDKLQIIGFAIGLITAYLIGCCVTKCSLKGNLKTEKESEKETVSRIEVRRMINCEIKKYDDELSSKILSRKEIDLMVTRHFKTSLVELCDLFNFMNKR